MQKLAIIGTGIAGMGAAHNLKDKFDITLFEQNNYIGGHTNTVYVEEGGKQVPIDTGFIVFNKVTYPNLVNLFKELNVPIKESNMSFSVQHLPSKLEYNGSGLNGIFSQRKNLLNPSFIKMIWQINRFNTESVSDMNSGKYDSYTLQHYLDEKKYSSNFTMKYLVPMSSAVWSSEIDVTLQFPFVTLVRFFQNHGMLGLNTQHQWYTVVNGSETYKQKLIQPFKNKILTNKGIAKVIRKNNQVEIKTLEGDTFTFDKVIIAAHADEALKMLDNPTTKEQELLSTFSYQKNIATLHTDESVMPKKQSVWSAWNYRIQQNNNAIQASTIYYMNMLQGVSNNKNYFVSINQQGSVKPNKVIKEFTYYHPIFSLESIKAQQKLETLNNDGPVYFCGSYFKYGFHEDAYTSGLNVSKKIISSN